MLDMRSYRGPNAEGLEETYGSGAYFLGPAQVAWLKRELVNSQATWKVIAADMPIGLIVVYDTDRKWGVDGIAQGDGPPRGRELEIADILSFIKRAGVRNTLWLTADVHYTAAHYYDPTSGVPGLRAGSGSWCQVRSTPEASRKISSTTRSGHSSSTSRRQARRTSRRVTACNFSVTSRSTEERNS